MTDISFIVKGLIQSIDNTIVGVYNPTSQLILCSDTKWLRVGKIVTKNSLEYRVITLVKDANFSVVPLVASSPQLTGTINLPAPFWISGTHIATNNEWSKASINLLNKTPIAWLLETLSMKFFGENDPREFESSIRLFFLDETDIVNFYSEDHREQVVVPMETLASIFVALVNNNSNFKKLDEWEIHSFSRFGVEKDEGMFKNILDANLSGVELKITITQYKKITGCE